MKILFIIDGTLDISHWSGTTMAIYNELRRYTELDLLEISLNWFDKNFIKFQYKLSRESIYPERTQRLLVYRKNIICKRLVENSYDAIFCIGSLVAASVPVVGIPVYMYIDGVLSIMKEYYSNKVVNKKSYRIANEIESIGLNKAVKTNGCIFAASNWCAKGVLEDYAVNSKFIEVVKIGANNLINFDSDKTKKDIINQRILNFKAEIRLLFIGIDWNRKGLTDTYELVRILHKKGLRVNLDIVGAEVIPPSDIASITTVHGKLNKSNSDEKEKMIQLYQNAHFFVFPTHAECVGAVICESGANALPVLANNTGGVPSLIENGKNGFLLDLDMNNWEKIISYYKSHIEDYRILCEESYFYYEKYLNWERICQNIYKIIDKDKLN